MKRFFMRIIVVFFMACSGYFLWKVLCPVEVVAVHVEPSTRYILVKNFPITVQGRISWWKDNKSMLREKYNVPEISYNGIQSVSFWGFGEGYQIKEPDRESFFPSKDTSYLLCFDDMTEKENCIRKNRLMRVAMTRDGVLLLYSGGEIYKEKENGEIVHVGKR